MRTSLCAVVLLVATPLVLAHSNLAEPSPTRSLVCRVGNEQPRDCPGPCPPMDSFGGPTGISESNPAATWTRGESKFVAWQRNNHGGDKNKNGPSGFTRLSLVPVKDMFDKDAHAKYAFHFACWGAGEHDCPSQDEIACGNDKTGRRYGAHVKVPTSYEDGVYVLGYSWFGGGDWKEESFFGDYYGCSFIKIQGGPYSATAKPVFAPGDNMPADGCFSSADRPGVCPSEPCLGKSVTKMKPYGLEGDASPPSAPSSAGADNGEKSPDAEQATQAPVKSAAPGLSQTAYDENDGNNHGTSFDLFLVNVKSSELLPLAGQAKFNLGNFGDGVNIVARPQGDVQSVVYEWNGKVRVERTAPFALAGNEGNVYSRWSDVPVNHEFTLNVNVHFANKSIKKSVKLLFSE